MRAEPGDKQAQAAVAEPPPLLLMLKVAGVASAGVGKPRGAGGTVPPRAGRTENVKRTSRL